MTGYQVHQEKSSPGLRAIDDMFSKLIPDASKSATSPRYRNHPDTVVLKAVDEQNRLVGALTAHSDRPDLAAIPPRERDRLNLPPAAGAVRTMTQVAVLPAVQGRGIGRQLVTAAEHEFSTSGAILSLVFVDDRSGSGAAEFYLAQNYSRASRHTDALTVAPRWLPPAAGLYREIPVARDGWFFYKEL